MRTFIHITAIMVLLTLSNCWYLQARSTLLDRLRDKRFNVPDIMENGDVLLIKELLSLIDKEIEVDGSGSSSDNIWLLKSKVMLLESLEKENEAASSLKQARLGTLELMHQFYGHDLPGQ